MASRKSAERDARLAAALRQNLKRRKTIAQGAGEACDPPAVAPERTDQASRPKTASKRN
jgi:hypothetical protein